MAEAAAIAEMAADDFGVDSFALTADDLADGGQDALRAADVSITTVFFVSTVRHLLDPIERPVFVATLDAVRRNELFSQGEPLYMLLAHRQWADRAAAGLAGTPAGEQLRLFVVGEDALDEIPPGATVHATAASAPLIPDAFRRDRRVRELRYALDSANACGLISTIVAA